MLSILEGTNQYWRQLTPEQIAAGDHRAFVGGMWREIGQLQFRFLKGEGLKKHHRLLDVGCGALRGGVHFVRYLDASNYHGLDVNASLLEASKVELEKRDLSDKRPNLLANDAFEVDRFGASFDYVLAVSLFTHLHLDQIARCLARCAEVLKPEGSFFATFFEAPKSLCLAPVQHELGGVVTNYDTDPFHQAFGELEWLAEQAGLSAEYVGEWGHPRGQRMLRFKRASQQPRMSTLIRVPISFLRRGLPARLRALPARARGVKPSGLVKAANFLRSSTSGASLSGVKHPAEEEREFCGLDFRPSSRPSVTLLPEPAYCQF